MPRSVQPMIVTPNLDRLVGFYTDLFDAKEAARVPEEGPTFFVCLQIGDSELGLVSDSAADLTAQRLEAAHVVSLPAMNRDRHRGEPLQSSINVNPKVGVLLFRQVVRRLDPRIAHISLSRPLKAPS